MAVTKANRVEIEAERDGPLERYLRVVEVVAASHGGVSLTDIATLTGLPKPTVHRLTRVLMDAGVLAAEDTHYKTFRVGKRLWRILYLGLDRDTIANYAQIVCDALAEELHETCYIVRLGQQHIRTIARSAPDQGHRLHVVPGAQLPAHAASSAKAILAFQDQATRSRILRPPLAKLASLTKTDPTEVEAELAEVRRSGFAVCDREIDDNVMAYACPVHLGSAGVLYSVGVTGPCSRLRLHPLDHWIGHLQRSAERFTEMLQTGKG